jgi:tetratricopeptide (TPR) repeat protein
MLSDLLSRADELRQQFTDQPLVLAAIDETLGGVYVRINRFKEAEELLRGALHLRKATQGEYGLEIAGTLNYLGHLYSRQSRWPEALDHHNDALELLQNRAPRETPEAARSLEIARTQRAIGWVLAHQAKLSEAEHYLRLALQTQQRDPRAKAEEAATLIFIGSVLTQDGRVAQAEEAIRRALDLNRAVFSPNSIQVASSLQALAVTIAVTQVRLPEAIQLYRDAFEIRERINNPDTHEDLRVRKFRPPPPTLEDVMTKPGMLAEVEALLRDAQQYAMTLYGRDSWEQAFFYALRAWVLLQEKRHLEAERVVRECLKIREALGPDDWSTHHARHMLGYALIGQGEERRTEGLDLMLVGFRGMMAERAGIPPFHKSRLGEAALRIREVYAHRGEVHKVDEWTSPRWA